jgi:hypothetical protein
MLPSLVLPAIAELARRPAWVCWRQMHKGDKFTKVPHTPAGSPASSTDSRTWSSYRECFAAAYVTGLHDGIGRVLTGDGIVGIDLDKCVAPSGEVAPWAAKLVHSLPTFWEQSPSGAGLHAWCRGHWPTDGNKRGGIEVYRRRRYLTVSGQHLGGTPEDIRAVDLEPLWRAHFAGRGGPSDARPAAELYRVLDLPAQTPDPLPRERLARLAHLCPQLRRVLESDYGGHRAPKDLALVRFAKLAGWHPRAAWRLLLSYDNPKAAGRPSYAARTIARIYLEDRR